MDGSRAPAYFPTSPQFPEYTETKDSELTVPISDSVVQTSKPTFFTRKEK